MQSEDRAEPRVTVLIPVYNGEQYLRESLDSILSQTYSDFELLVIDDGSRDGTAVILEEYRIRDRRVRVVHNKINLGLIHSLNRGIKLSRGFYIARMDQDDISMPYRLEKQVEFMDAHLDIGICGTWFEMFSAKKSISTIKHPIDPDTVKCYMFANCEIAHPSVIIRKNLINKYNILYDSEYKHAEDYAFWVTAMRQGVKISNLAEVLLRYRRSSEQVSQLNSKEQLEVTNRIRGDQLRDLGVSYSYDDLLLHSKIMARKPYIDKEEICNAGKWLEKIRQANIRLQVYPEPLFSKFLAQKWFMICYRIASPMKSILSIYFEHPLNREIRLPINHKIKFFIKHIRLICRYCGELKFDNIVNSCMLIVFILSYI